MVTQEEKQVNHGINIGDRFLCIEDLNFGPNVCYRKGRVYKSEVEGCITNENGNKMHHWSLGGMKNFFTKLKGRKRKSK